MNCTHCHTPVPDGGRYCPTCGLDVTDPGASPPTERGVAARSVKAMAEQTIDHLAQVEEGHYKIHKVIGRGGMGVVLLADDLVLERPVAIKVLPPEYSHEAKVVGRFQSEARTAAKLDHPNIVPIFAVESKGGLHYFVMKYVTGHTVQDLVEAGPMPVEYTQRVLADAALALAHAHKKGVIHRDIKPGNVMIDDEGRGMLMDFGISKAVQSAARFTATGQIVGTPHYMSPEQAKGLEVDGRTDQYSLALVGYQMLTGKVAFEADSAHAVLYKQISEPPPPIEAIRPDAPPHLVKALMRALAKEPAARFTSMTDFAAAIQNRAVEAYATGTDRPRHPTEEPTIVATPSAGPRKGQGRWLAMGGGALALAVAAVLVVPGLMKERPAVPAAADSAPAPAAPAPVPAPVVNAESIAAESVAAAQRARDQARLEELSRRTAQRAQQAAPPVQPAAPPAAAAPAATAAEVGYLTLDADPFGTVSVDGVDVGDTPIIRRQLRPGTYSVRISREGFRAWTGSVTITAGNTASRRVQLVPNQ